MVLPLPRLLAHCQVCDTVLNGLWPLLIERGRSAGELQVSLRCYQGFSRSVLGNDLQLLGKKACCVEVGRGGGVDLQKNP